MKFFKEILTFIILLLYNYPLIFGYIGELIMAIDTLQTLEIIEVMENFLSRKRPPLEIRKKLDLGYKIEDQSIIVFEIRPQWNKPEVIREHPVAKTTFVKANNHWKVFWMRANLKWYSYSPKPKVKHLIDFFRLVEKDEYHCFWG